MTANFVYVEGLAFVLEFPSSQGVKNSIKVRS
jgi:hypothetical protein